MARAKSKAKVSGEMLLPWSYSRLAMYERCPLQAKLRFIDKVPEPTVPAFKKGNHVHAVLEKYVAGLAKDLTLAKVKESCWGVGCVLTPKAITEINSYRKYAKQYNHTDGYVVATEAKFGFDKDWNPLAGWFADGVWCRMGADVVIDHGRKIVVVDYKTGKLSDSHEDQGRLYALGMMLRAANAMTRAGAGTTTIETRFVYVEHNHIIVKRYPVKKIGSHLTWFRNRVEKMVADTAFEPAKNDKCKWCTFKLHCPVI